MAILDILEGVLGKEAIDKIKSNTRLGTDLMKSDELFNGYYGRDVGTDDDGNPVKVASSTVQAVVTERTTPPAASASTDLTAVLESLKTITSRLDAMPDPAKAVETKFEDLLKTRGAELLGQAEERALRKSDQLNRVRDEHRETFGEKFDTDKFAEFIEEHKKTGTSFATVEKAYEAFVAPKLTEKRVADGIRDGLKAKATNAGVPGVTPPSSKSTLAHLINRGRSQDGNGQTATQRAGDQLAARLAASQNDV
jgi:hypothetical protein